MTTDDIFETIPGDLISTPKDSLNLPLTMMMNTYPTNSATKRAAKAMAMAMTTS